jgi:HK97 family phage major capsid protein
MNDREHDWRADHTKAVGLAALAKCGVSNINLGAGARSDLIQDRNECRRALNQLSGRSKEASERKDTKAAEQYLDEMMAIGAFVRRLDILIDCADPSATAGRSTASDWKATDGSAVKVLRAGDDFRAHYSADRQANSSFDLADFIRGVAGMRTSQDVQAALSVGTDTAGGYAVPSILMPGIMDALVPASSLLQAGAGIVPLTEGAKTYTTAAVNAIPTAAWRSEAGTVAASDPTFRSVVATPRSLSFYFKVSRELLADAPNLRPALERAIAQAFAKELDRAGLRGTGTAPEPRGILNTSSIQSVANGANGAAQAGLRWSNLMSAYQAIIAADAPAPTAAIMAPRSFIGFGNLADSTNQPLMRPDTLKSMRFLSTSQIPVNLTVGTSNDCTEIYVGNFSSVLFMMRENVSVQLLNEAFSSTGEIGFMCHVRADVVVEYPAALAVVTGVRA